MNKIPFLHTDVGLVSYVLMKLCAWVKWDDEHEGFYYRLYKMHVLCY